eukprot:symbB.v1.2.000325.t1/scaffold6.1/size569917/28
MHALDADLLKKDLEAKLQRLVEEERHAQGRLRDDHPAALYSNLPLQPGEVLPSEPRIMDDRRGEIPFAEDEINEIPLLSVGTRGHPKKCRPVCRFFRRRSGCRDGASCKYCHACVFQEPETNYIGVSLHKSPFSAAGPVPPGAMARPSTSLEYPSMGSYGHPLSCAPACKYNSKSKGCKDGALCDHCHLCRWKRHFSGSGAGRVPRDAQVE